MILSPKGRIASVRLEQGAGPRDRILAEASRLFRERGYHGASMRALARVVNLQSGSLYSHIESKDDLLWEIANRAADHFLAEAASVPDSLPPAARLSELVRRHIMVMASELQDASVFFHEWRHLSPQRKAAMLAKRHRYEAYFQTTVEEGMRLGHFHVEDPRLATLFVLSALNWTYQWLKPDGRLAPRELADLYSRLVVRSLGAEPAPTPAADKASYSVGRGAGE